LRLLANGRTLAEVAGLLNLSGKTVANYQTSIREKLGADNTFQVMRLAIERGLVLLPPVGNGNADPGHF